ncbi:M23 family metallopeptidase [Pseudoalteromonas sp. R3]|uniref:M23 family metallopeptidase n=1 Tax=Pseudoalteromonas sp. R3 TaxID=1709477 RepID=UPI0006B6266D|nr:M23 family metallopeptidase [Pseudoalteromonas sp. R3]AZZ98152.1 M23 family metallopeptidase [Pseudoalteromonas sp. R3]
MPKETAQSPQTTFAFTWLVPLVVAVGVTLGAQFICQWVWGVRLPVIAKLTVYFSSHFICACLVKKYLISQPGNEPHPGLSWPRPGIHRYLGRYGMMFTALPSLALTFLNPLLAFQQAKLIVCQRSVARRVSAGRNDMAGYQNKVRYQLPFEGRWLVYNGGNTPLTSHSWGVLSQRFALDFVMVDHNYSRHTSKGLNVSDYYCFNQPILAAADGEVVAVFDKVAQAPLVGFGMIDFLCRHFAGNHVVVKHAPGEYGFYAHLNKGSVPVKVGDRVKQGELLGHCGFSGFTSEPHLHFHLQDHPNMYCAMGLPVTFWVTQSLESHQGALQLTRGMLVGNEMQ